MTTTAPATAATREALGPTLWDERVSVLRKPFAAEDLLARVARVLQSP